MAALPLRMRNSRIRPYLDPCFPYGLVSILLNHLLLYISPFQTPRLQDRKQLPTPYLLLVTP